MWTKQAVDEAVKSYAQDKARTAHLAVEIAELERRISTAVRNLAGDEAGPKAQKISDMPHGTSVGNPTAQLAEKLASGWLPPEVKEMQGELAKVKVEHQKTSVKVKYVEAWMAGLSERESWIVKHKYIQNEFWREVLEGYEREFGGYVTKDTLKWLRGKAFKSMYKAAGIRN